VYTLAELKMLVQADGPLRPYIGTRGRPGTRGRSSKKRGG
jgi:hypothetical protein